jgi:hypothetical protein
VIRHISLRSSSENIINSSRILTTLNMYISASILGGIVAISASANAALVRVNDFGSNPTNLQMNIYVPSRVATKPAIILGVRLTHRSYTSPPIQTDVKAAAPLRWNRRTILLVHQVQQPRGHQRLHQHLPLDQERQQLLGSQHRQRPLPR